LALLTEETKPSYRLVDMSTKTLAWVVGGIAAAVLGGAIIWAVSEEGDSTREAALRETATPTGEISYRVRDLPAPSEFAVGSYSIGMTKAERSTTSTTTTTTTDKYASSSEPLRFSKPLDDVSLTLFNEATRSRVQPKVTLDLLMRTPENTQPVPAMRYEFLSAVVGVGDETAAKGGRSRQDVELFFKSMSIALETPDALGYASEEDSVGYLRIPGVADEPEGTAGGKPAAYVTSYSWGWENANAAAVASGATTTGKFMVKSVTIGRRLDSHAPWFWQQLVNTKPITELELVLKQPASPEQVSPVAYATYKLTGAQVVSVHDSGGETPMQQIKLDFGTIELRAGSKTESFVAPTKTG
jgi:type VI protein secretion system component Hcp